MYFFIRQPFSMIANPIKRHIDRGNYFSHVFLFIQLPVLLKWLSLVATNDFQDFISIAFCNLFSNIAAAIATPIETKVATTQIARKPAGSSSWSWNIRMYNPAITIKMLSMIAQYFMLFKALTAFDENTLSCRMYPSNLKVLYSAKKKTMDAAYPYKMNGSE